MVKNVTYEQLEELRNGGNLDCKILHDGSCEEYYFYRIFKVYKNVYKSYLFFYFSTMIFF